MSRVYMYQGDSSLQSATENEHHGGFPAPGTGPMVCGPIDVRGGWGGAASHLLEAPLVGIPHSRRHRAGLASLNAGTGNADQYGCERVPAGHPLEGPAARDHLPPGIVGPALAEGD